jgi:hypothetical protein
LEIGDGSGHGGTLGWIYFRPRQRAVEVLDIQFDEGWHQYRSKWPPDNAPVAVRRASMKHEAYASLLRDLADVDAAELREVERDFSSMSTNDFWVYARLIGDRKTLIDLNWAGYRASGQEVSYGKPRAAVALARAAVSGLAFKEHTLTAAERRWASAKFTRDWTKFRDLDFHWWVRERYIIMIGVVGDKTALPTLRAILGGDPKDRRVYYAINAVTRLTKKDVRDKPIEEMNVETTRRKVLDLLRARK